MHFVRLGGRPQGMQYEIGNGFSSKRSMKTLHSHFRNCRRYLRSSPLAELEKSSRVPYAKSDWRFTFRDVHRLRVQVPNYHTLFKMIAYIKIIPNPST